MILDWGEGNGWFGRYRLECSSMSFEMGSETVIEGVSCSEQFTSEETAGVRCAFRSKKGGGGGRWIGLCGLVGIMKEEFEGFRTSWGLDRGIEEK